jgi:hypothetical protein
MKFNLKKSSKIAYEQIDRSLEDQRTERGHENLDGEGSYDKALGETRKDKEIESITEKQFDHKEPEQEKTLEARMDDERTHFSGNWRDDRTHKTNTLPINELAEERQRKRMELRGDGDGFEPAHFQEYKKESIDLMHENFAELKDLNNELDKVYTASSEKRMTTSERLKVTALKTKRNRIINGLHDESRKS